MKLDKDALVELIKKKRARLNEDKKQKGHPPVDYWTGFFHDGRISYPHHVTYKDTFKEILDWACNSAHLLDKAETDRHEGLSVMTIVCPSGETFDLDKAAAKRGCTYIKDAGKWTGAIPHEYYENCTNMSIAESKDYKRLASKWLTEKRKISAEKNSRFLLSVPDRRRAPHK